MSRNLHEHRKGVWDLCKPPNTSAPPDANRTIVRLPPVSFFTLGVPTEELLPSATELSKRCTQWQKLQMNTDRLFWPCSQNELAEQATKFSWRAFVNHSSPYQIEGQPTLIPESLG
jgi:hypothetical protein